MKNDTCKHFTGIQNDCCAAGINYDDVRRLPGPIPCLPHLHKEGTKNTCDKFEIRTKEEFEALMREADESIAEAKKDIALILPMIAAMKEEFTGRQGVKRFDCPKCGAARNLVLTHSEINGHVWGRCSTKDCLVWME